MEAITPAAAAARAWGQDQPEATRVLVERLDEAVATWAAEPTRHNAERMAGAAEHLAAHVRIHTPPRPPLRPVACR